LKRSDKRLSVVNKSRFQASVTLIFVRRTSVLDVTRKPAKIFLSAPGGWSPSALVRSSRPGLTICYPALIRPPYLEESGGLLIDQMERLAEQLPFPLLHEKLPNWSAVQRGLQEGRCDLIPNVGPSLQALPGMALSRAMLEAESAILYRGDLERATFLVSPIWQANEVLRALYPRSTQLPLTEADNWYAALAAGKGTAYLGDYLQLRYLMREYPDQGLRLRRLRSDELVVSYRLMMRDQPELREPPVPSSWSSTRISCPTAVSTSRGSSRGGAPTYCGR